MDIHRILTAYAIAASAALFAGIAAAQPTIVVCESHDYRNQECPVPGGQVTLNRQLSSPPGNCIEGQTWGVDHRNNTVWVSNGCRAEFRVAGAQPRPVPSPGMTVTCESQDYRNHECPVPGGPVVLVQQLSSPPGDCIEGRTWGYNHNNNTVWVSNGCRGEFGIGQGHRPTPVTTVTCESQDYRNAECAVPGGPVVLIQQLSSPPGDCVEGRTWGFNPRNNTVWVSNGCRGEFRTGYR